MKRKLTTFIFLLFLLLTLSFLTPFKKAKASRVMTYKGIAAGWNNLPSSTYGYNCLILSFGTHNVDFLADNEKPDATNRATSSYDIGKKLTINGVPIYKIHEKFPSTKVGYDHGYAYFYIVYPVEILSSYKSYYAPTIHIEANTEFMDVLLPEVTLKYLGGVWIENNKEDYKIENPYDFTPHLCQGLPGYRDVVFPYTITSNAGPIFVALPPTGVSIAYNINTGDINPATNSYAFLIDGFYQTTIAIYFSNGSVSLTDKATGGIVQTFYGLSLLPNTDYLIEMGMECGTTSRFRLAINHVLMIDYTFNSDKSGQCDVWSLDTSNFISISNAKALPEYKPQIVYGGSSTYDFNEGDPLYDFSNLVEVFDMFDDTAKGEISFDYSTGAVTDNKYNEGKHTLNINTNIDGVSLSKVININVHGTTSIVPVYFDGSGVISAKVGSKIEALEAPESYTEGGYDYVFEGWYYNGAKWNFETDTVEGEMHLYPKFKKMEVHNKVSVNFVGLNLKSEEYLLTSGKTLPFNIFSIDGATFEVFEGENKIDSLVVNGDTSLTVKYKVVYEYIEPKDATCTEDGNIGYYYSAVYKGYYFGDPNGMELIKDPTIKKYNHNIIHLNETDSTCTKIGNVDCFYCTICEKHFSDSSALTELENWKKEAVDHQKVLHEGFDATCERDGVVEHYTCLYEPGVYYKDSSLTETIDSVVIKALGHEFYNPSYTWSENDGTYSCTASIKCIICNKELTEEKIGEVTIISDSSCVKEGEVSYFVRFDNPLFNTQTKIINSPLINHTLESVSAKAPTESENGIKEHYVCAYCHSYFIKNGDEYIKTNYSDLIIELNNKEKKRGCKNVVFSSILSSISLLTFSFVLYKNKRKEER